ncbi:MAG TPA: cysteine hydrolase [Kofleriaceae bacterium]|nr:cysteine hydrolase [Kofleriaceae bacterium]
MLDIPLIPSGRSALLSLDCQREVALPGGVLAPPDTAAQARFGVAIERGARALGVARGLGIPVIHLKVAFAPGYHGLNRTTPMGQKIVQREALLEGSRGAEIILDLAPTDDEVVLTKHMVSGFSGTDLDQVLRGLDAGTLILMGLVTHLAVEGTARDAADRGYRVVVLGDACASGDDRRHRTSLELLGRLGDVIQVASLSATVG